MDEVEVEEQHTRGVAPLLNVPSGRWALVDIVPHVVVDDVGDAGDVAAAGRHGGGPQDRIVLLQLVVGSPSPER